MATQESTTKALTTQTESTSLQQLIEKSAKEFKRALPAHMRPERLVRIALTCIRQTPELAQCTPASFVGALLVAAQLGLEPVAGRAYILPFWNDKIKKKEAQFIIGYKGLADLFYRHDKSVQLTWGTVHKEDYFEYEYGTNAFLKHRPSMKDGGEVLGYYVIAELQGSAKPFQYMSKEECIEHGKKHSKTFDAKKGEWHSSSPWVRETDAMCKKTVLIQLGKLLPLSIELQRAIAQDETSRDYREGIDDALDFPHKEWGEDVIEAEGQEVMEDKLLEIGSPLHKKFEATIADKKWDRVLLKEYLLQKGRLEIDPEKGSPSFSTLQESWVREFLDRLDDFETAFNAWLAKKDENAE